MKLIFFFIFFNAIIFFSMAGAEEQQDALRNNDEKKSCEIHNEKANYKSTVYFGNKDHLAGFLSQWNGTSFEWYSVDAEKNIVFSSANISYILNSDPTPYYDFNADVQITMKNRSCMSGKLIKYQDNILSLKTSLNSELQIPIHEIHEIELLYSDKQLGSPKDWQTSFVNESNESPSIMTNEVGWFIKRKGEMQKNIKFPEQFLLEFFWLEKSKLEFIFQNTNNDKEYLKIQLEASQNKFLLNTRNDILEVKNEFALDNEFNKFCFYIDRKKGKIEFHYGNNVIIPEGTFCFSPDTLKIITFGPTTLRNFTISPHDGVIIPKNILFESNDLSDDQLFLKNKDHLSGALHSIMDNKLIFKTIIGEISFTLSQLKKITIATKSPKNQEFPQNQFKIEINSQHQFVGEIEKVENQHLFLKCSSLGKLSIPLTYIKKISPFDENLLPPVKDIEPLLYNKKVHPPRKNIIVQPK